MSARNRLVAAGIATFLIGIVLSFPARIAYQWFAPPALRLAVISGTVWSGQAAEGYAGGFYLSNLRWSFLPLSLFKGRLAYAVSTDTAFGPVRSDVGLTAGGAIALGGLDARFSLQAFKDVFQLQGFDGTLQMSFDSLVLQDGFPTEAIGKVRLLNLLAPNISPLVIGDYEAAFSSGEDGIIGAVEDKTGVLDVAGSITLGSDRSYAFVGKIAARPDAPPGLSNQLRFLGSPNERGQRDFRVEGQL